MSEYTQVLVYIGECVRKRVYVSVCMHAACMAVCINGYICACLYVCTGLCT